MLPNYSLRQPQIKILRQRDSDFHTTINFLPEDKHAYFTVRQVRINQTFTKTMAERKGRWYSRQFIKTSIYTRLWNSNDRESNPKPYILKYNLLTVNIFPAQN